MPQTATTVGLAAYFAFRHALIDPKLRAGIGEIATLLVGLDEEHPKAEVARLVLERAHEPEQKVERVVTLARKVGRDWHFGAIATEILACKAFANDAALRRLDAHLERLGSHPLLWRELLADARGDFLDSLRARCATLAI